MGQPSVKEVHTTVFSLLIICLCFEFCWGSVRNFHPSTIQVHEGYVKRNEPLIHFLDKSQDGEREKRQATAREQSLETDLNALVPAEQGLTDYEVKNACRCVPFYNCCNDTATAGFCAEAIDIKNNLDFKENRCSVDYFECCSFTDLCGEDVDCLIQVSLVPPSASQSSSPETTSSSSETNASSEATITPPSIAYKPVPPTIREPPALSEPIPCGRRNFDGVGVRLAGSAEIQQAQYGEFPWMVALLREDTIGRSQPIDVYVCGAVLISPHLVATAAHCVNDYAKGLFFNLKARLGEWDALADSEPYHQQDFRVKSIVIHPEFRPRLVLNDIAILVLEHPVQFSSFVSPICLPSEAENEQYSRIEKCVVTGWGRDSFYGRMQNVLKLIEIPTVPKSTCEEKLRDTRLGPRFKLHPSFICAGGNGIDACKGDGGSPLVCPSLHTGSDVQSIRYVLTGLVAWGIGCAGIPPGVYVNVPYFMPWLEPFLKEYDPGYDYFGHS